MPLPCRGGVGYHSRAKHVKIFWTSKNTVDAWNGTAMLTRWVLCGEWTYLELHQEYRKFNDVWNDRKRYVRIDISKKFRLGTSHMRWDCNHCSWLLGFVQVSWSLNENCRKCAGK